MKRKVLVGVAGLFLIFGLSSHSPGEDVLLAEVSPFLHQEDFEEKDPMGFWYSTGKEEDYTVNFKGLTEEKAFSGEKSFKLDVTFKKSVICIWQIPVKIPAEGESLTFSGRILVEEGSAGQCGLGVNMGLSPSMVVPCSLILLRRHKSSRLASTPSV